MELNAFPKSIEDTLSLQRKYIIPRFQREYSWENEELSELFEDLLTVGFLPSKERLR